VTRIRLTAAERGERLIDAAIIAFARSGYAGTTTDDVARLAGISQPYVIRLFGSKRSLFLAAVEHACARVEDTVRRAAPAEADTALRSEREVLAVLLHAYAASFDEVIAAVVRRRYGRVYQVIREKTGASLEDARSFLGHAMLSVF
jgi:AcrR family transcriptional regulator